MSILQYITVKLMETSDEDFRFVFQSKDNFPSCANIPKCPHQHIRKKAEGNFVMAEDQCSQFMAI